MDMKISFRKTHLIYLVITMIILTGINYSIAQTGKPNPGHDISEISGIEFPTYGDTFVHWGNQACPSNTELLYSGFAFNNNYNTVGGSTDNLCVKANDPGAQPGSVVQADFIVPLETADGLYVDTTPPGIDEGKQVQCSVCYSPGPIVEIWGTSTCPSGWSAAYTGYTMGAFTIYYHKTNRICVDNINFDSSVSSSSIGGKIWGTVIDTIEDLEGQGYERTRFVKCAVCVKNA